MLFDVDDVDDNKLFDVSVYVVVDAMCVAKYVIYGVDDMIGGVDVLLLLMLLLC